jgi:KaiC/GvpD/RAD55 family RecA-like ATPase
MQTVAPPHALQQRPAQRETTNTSWQTFIQGPQPAEHAVQIYEELDELAHSVGRFLVAGIDSGAPAVVIATAEHRSRFTRELEEAGADLGVLEQRGRLIIRDAEETLASFMAGDLPAVERFDAVVGRLIDDVASRFPGRTIRVFGEMVDILWARGQSQAAIALEQLWNALAERRSFALLCGYHLDIFDIDVQTGALPDVFRTHSHARPTAEPSRLAAAVDKALVEIVGPRGAAYIYLDVAEQMRRDKLHRAQALLTRLSATNRALAASLLERTRTHFTHDGHTQGVPQAAQSNTRGAPRRSVSTSQQARSES